MENQSTDSGVCLLLSPPETYQLSFQPTCDGQTVYNNLQKDPDTGRRVAVARINIFEENPVVFLDDGMQQEVKDIIFRHIAEQYNNIHRDAELLMDSVQAREAKKKTQEKSQNSRNSSRSDEGWHFSSEKIVAAKASVSLVDYLRRRGYELVPHGNGLYHIKDNGDEHNSIVIYPHTNSWSRFKPGDKRGGDVLDFMQQYEGYTFTESVKLLTGAAAFRRSPRVLQSGASAPVSAHKTVKKFALPELSKCMVRSYGYLIQGRKIDPEIVRHFAATKQILEDKKHNCLFVGYDENGVPAYASARGTVSDVPYKRDVAGSRKKYGFSSVGTSDRLYVFESPIDLLSFLSLHKDKDWKQHSYLSLGGVYGGALDHFLENHPNIKRVAFCLDNDEAGQSATNYLSKKIQPKGYATKSIPPADGKKDWNEQLVAQSAQKNQLPATAKASQAEVF